MTQEIVSSLGPLIPARICNAKVLGSYTGHNTEKNILGFGLHWFSLSYPLLKFVELIEFGTLATWCGTPELLYPQSQPSNSDAYSSASLLLEQAFSPGSSTSIEHLEWSLSPSHLGESFPISVVFFFFTSQSRKEAFFFFFPPFWTFNLISKIVLYFSKYLCYSNSGFRV